MAIQAAAVHSAVSIGELAFDVQLVGQQHIAIKYGRQRQIIAGVVASDDSALCRHPNQRDADAVVKTVELPATLGDAVVVLIAKAEPTTDR